MDGQFEINVLISNIIDEKQYSHCRLCLKYIEDHNYTRLRDVVLNSNDEYLLLDEVLTKILGKEACEEIPGINAVCNNCVRKALETFSFVELYETCTLKLNKILDNLNVTLNIDQDVIKNEQKLFIECAEDESRLIFVQHNLNKPTPKVALQKCYSCMESFNNIIDFKEHNERDHGTYTCEKCTYINKNVDAIIEHEVSIDYFKCKKCPQYRCTEDSLTEHEEATHGIHVCMECGKSYRGLEKLLAHEEKHTTKKYICSKCGKTYVTKEFFNKHVKLCLEDRMELHPVRSKLKKTYFCQECGKGYSAPGGLRVHEKFVHGNAKPHVCNECGKKFTAPCYLKVHMLTHTKEKNFPCEMCEGKFVSKEALLYHVRRHTGEKPYSCDTCNERFVNASARAEHVKFKHIGPTLRCELCSRMFVTKNFLRQHLRKHYDPANKLYIGRANIPPNVPGEENMRVRK